MVDYLLFTDLCESHLIPSQSSLSQWDVDRLADLSYLYLLALRILLGDEATKKWAEHYCAHAAQQNHFTKWRNDGNDLYVLLYALIGDPGFKDAKRSVSTSALRDWMHHVHDQLDQATQRLFNRLDAMFRVRNAALRGLRRQVMHWDDLDNREQRYVLTQVKQQLKKLAPKSELLSHLKTLEHASERPVEESASCGATGAASVATAVGGLGSGFDPNGDRGVYQNKPVMIRRSPAKKAKSS